MSKQIKGFTYIDKRVYGTLWICHPPSYFESQFSLNVENGQRLFSSPCQSFFFLLQVFCLFILPFHIFCTYISLISFLHLHISLK
uniref:Uncharacterized protein n=1 Tax=Meloidogyne enterolobii TaxID=390850 RepID=A0A6V7WKA4_MELEN|nr:unnamed protein product [Meloidogyne enterolobii]